MHFYVLLLDLWGREPRDKALLCFASRFVGLEPREIRHFYVLLLDLWG